MTYMSESFLKKNFKTKLDSHYRNVVDYLIISKDIETGSWDKSPMKTALCYRALKNINELKNEELTEKWMKEWFTKLSNFSLDKPEYSRNVKEYVEGAAEIIESLKRQDIDKEVAGDFFEKTMLKNNINAGSWEGDIVITSKVLRGLKKLGIQIPQQSKDWLKEQINNHPSIIELASLIAYTDLFETEEIIPKIKSRLQERSEIGIREINNLLKVTDFDVDREYFTVLESEIRNSSSFPINAGLTKALWQSVSLKAASYSGNDIKDKLEELTDRYWVEYIEEITDDSKIILNLENDVSSMKEGRRDIVLLADILLSLEAREILISVDVPKKHFEELKDLNNKLKKYEIIGNPLIAEKFAVLVLGVISSVGVFWLSYSTGFLQFTIENFPYINIPLLDSLPLGWVITIPITAFLLFLGFEGSIKRAGKKTKEIYYCLKNWIPGV